MDDSHYAMHVRANKTSAENIECVANITDSVTGNRLESCVGTKPQTNIRACAYSDVLPILGPRSKNLKTAQPIMEERLITIQ